MNHKLFIFPLLSLLFFFGCYKAETKTAAGKLRLEKIGNFNTPVYASPAPGAQGLYVVEQKGKVVLTKSGQKTTFLDIESQVTSGGEQGLLSIAFSPGFRKNRLFYIYYTDREKRQVVAEGRSNSSATRGKIIRPVLVMDDFADNHNGGQIQFGPDGLYIATGDGGGSGDPERAALNLDSFLGKILRINPEKRGSAPYSIPADNPFSQDGGLPEIFSYGLRNPWRFSIADGRIWIGDVGQNDIEEINAPTIKRAKGASFGWSAYEGTDRFNQDQKSEDFIRPVLQYRHKEGRCSVTGGYLVQTNNLPSLKGRYIYGDFCQGRLRSFKLVGSKATDDRTEGLSTPSLASFAKGRGGNIFVISSQGPVYRLSQ